MDCLFCSPILYIFLIFLWCLVKTLLNRSLLFPPGPKGYPIIGNLNLKDKLSHRGLAELAKQYGGLLHLQMGKIHIIAVSTAEMAREILQVSDFYFVIIESHSVVFFYHYPVTFKMTNCLTIEILIKFNHFNLIRLCVNLILTQKSVCNIIKVLKTNNNKYLVLVGSRCGFCKSTG